jgi:prepilin-type N-terminal cleavage/methylation domain-containing protein
MRRAFTLIELLIVIAILAVLAGIGYSATGEVRERARQTGCVSNLRQFGIAIQMYRQDYNGIEVGTPEQMGLPPAPLVFIDAIRPSGGRYLKQDKSVLLCPNLPPELREQLHPEERWVSVYNYQTWRPGEHPGPSFEECVRQRGSDYPIMIDTWHDRPRADRIPTTQLLLLLRLDGRVSRSVASRRAPVWQR